MEGRDILLYLALKYNGNWDAMYNAIKQKEDLPKNLDIEKIKEDIKCNYVTLIDSDYPECLKPIYKPPFILFYYGDLNLIKNYRRNLSVVGTREPSKYGEEVTKNLVEGVCDHFNIVSGFANGIDSIAHKTCIENGGKTIAVLGCGIDKCYPNSNYKIYDEIKNNHLLISEYPCKVDPNKDNFPFRNRLVAAFSKALLVIEGGIKSGTSITANYALNYGREVLAVPTRIDKDSICNNLIKDGADLIRNKEDILKYYEYYS